MNKFVIYEYGPDELLKNVTGEIRSETVPPMPELPAVQLPQRDRSAARNGSSRGFPLRTLVAAAATIAFVILLVWPQSTKSAFARMQEALASVKTISYAVFDYHADGKEYETRVTVVESSFSRAESTHGGTHIVDWNQNLALSIDDDKRTATFNELSPSTEMTNKRQQLLAKFRAVSENATEYLGKTTWNDKPAEALMMPLGDRTFRVIVDSATGLPTRMEYDGTAGGLPGFTEVITDFVFDAEIDPTLFALDAPDGYQVTHHALAEPSVGAGLLTVSTTTGLNALPFGSSRQAITDFLGEPESTRTAYSTETLSYNHIGLEIFVHTKDGMNGIRCQSQARQGARVHDFAGQTVEGIGMGDSLEDVIAAYGEPDLLHLEVVNYVRLGWQFYLQENRVVAISVGQPMPDNIDFSVNKDDGSITTFVKDD